MKTVALVPVKRLAEAKSRLAPTHSPEERAALTLTLMRHVLSALEASGAVDTVAVISPYPPELSLPDYAVPILQQRPGLNHLLEQGRAWALAEKANALMVVLADLPLLTPDDIAAIVDMGRPEKTLVLAPDRHRLGTNIMLAHPPSVARFAFGTHSFRKHGTHAMRAGARLETYISTGTELDIDTPDDLEQLEKSSESAA